MAFYLRGVNLPHRKHTNAEVSEAMPAPKSVILPMSMHIGKAAVPTVKVGDEVCVGTLVAEQDGFISSRVYSSVSGKVTKIADMLASGGHKVTTIVIESDGNMTPDPTISAPVIDSREAFVEAVKASGVVGLGGAGFPTYVKFNVDPEKIDELIVNGAECEPYITSDSHTMINKSEDMALAIDTVIKYYGLKKVIIGVERNKKKAIESMKKLASRDSRIEVRVLPEVYPQGGEKVLVYHTTGKKIPLGKLPADVGCIVCNCTTLAAIGNYIKRGMPLTKKCVTVDGGAVKEPKNVIVPIGTPISEVFEFCGGLVCEPKKVLYGGPMMGISVPSLDAPVLKNTNALLALVEKETETPKPTSCIKCGSCVNTCPFGINPAEIARAYEKGDLESAARIGVELCMECGCCSFVCPAVRPLVQINKLTKAALREAKAKEEKR